MIQKVNHICTKLNKKLGISVPLPNPGRQPLKAAAVCNLVAGAGLAAAGVVFSSKLCIALGGIGLISSAVLRRESGSGNEKK